MTMAYEDALHSMHDQGLRPRLLLGVMANYLPDDKQVTRAPAQLSLAVASIRRHHLLWETSPAPDSGLHFTHGTKLLDSSKGAVDSWMEKLLNLLSSTVAENRWAGACLLGVSSQECTRQRFLECYSLWFTKLLLPLKQLTDPTFVRAAACASLTDLIVRLGGVIEHAGVRRDGANLISKLVQPLLQILGDKDSSGIWNEAMDLLSAALRYFPACLRQQSNSVEALLVARIMDVDCHSSLSQKCARALALLPKAHGDASTWSSLLRRILIAINSELDFSFTGMEDAAAAEDAIAALLPQGQEPPWPLGGRVVSANAGGHPGKSIWQQLVPRVSFLLQCCNYMLTSPFPVPVPAPLGPLLALSIRILRVDGSRSPSASRLGGAVFSNSHQAALCSELPTLHLSALTLLASTLCGVRSQLLPRGADLVRLISDYFRRSGVLYSSLRIKLYAIARHLFVTMGAGMAYSLAPAVVGNALSDLKGSTSGANIFSPKFSRGPRISNPVWTSGGWGGNQGTNHKKRKEPGGLPGEHLGNGILDAVSSPVEGAAPVAVQIAALQALEALLTSGGAILPERWRAEVDAILASVAMGAATGSISGSLAFEEECSLMEGTTSNSLSPEFQVAAYQALLASLLSPCCHRPPYLAQGLAVFRNGRQEAGTEVAAVCAHALLSLEPLIHPRCLPPAGTTVAVAAGMTAGRATTSSTLGSHLQRPNKAISAPGPLAGMATNMANGYGVPVVSSLKIGQLAMDPWAEVDTWLGYGEDFGDDDSLFYPESDGIVVEDFANGGLGGALGYGGPLLNSTEGQVAPSCRANGNKVSGGPLDFRKQSLAQRETIANVQQGIVECHAEPIPMEKDAGSYRDQGSGVETSATFPPIESSSQGDILQDSRPMMAGRDREAVDVGPVEIILAKPAALELGRLLQNNQGEEIGSQLESSIIPTESFGVTNTAHPATEGTFNFPRAPVDIPSDSDSDGPLPDIIDGDPDPESD